VRHRQLVALAAVALAGLAGCANRPNDLSTYYNDPTTSAAPQPPSPPPVPSTPPTTSREPSALVRTVTQAALIDSDLAAEGVQPAEPPSQVTGCLTTLPPTEDPALLHSANWQYPSGSSLRHQVVGYPTKEAAAVLSAVHCPGQELTLPAAPGIDVQHAWCEGSTCTVLLAQGRLVSGVQVTASTGVRAAEAAKRLAKVVVAKLSAAT
jgi:hypothetical protein